MPREDLILIFSLRMFAIDNNGELRIRDLTSLNSTEAHIMVMAKDSGVPPRMVSGGGGGSGGVVLMEVDGRLPTVPNSFPVFILTVTISLNAIMFPHTLAFNLESTI